MADERSSSDGDFVDRFPNYDDAIDVEQITPDEASSRFFSDFVERHRPCVIREAVSQWPATKRWQPDFLRDRVGALTVGASGLGVVDEPVVEFSLARLTRSPSHMTFGEFLDQVDEPSRRRVQIYSEHLHALEPLRQDLGSFDFLDRSALPSRFYGDRFFISKRGYTDWHVHFGDETLTAQLTGRKELLLLPPDNATFSTMLAMARRGVWKAPRATWSSDFAALIPYRVVLEPGDAVYIPMHWWHAAEALDGDLNVTLAQVFGSPSRWLADVRLKNVWFSLAQCSMSSVSDAISYRQVRPLTRFARLSWMTARGARAARAANGLAPGGSAYWGIGTDRTNEGTAHVAEPRSPAGVGVARR